MAVQIKHYKYITEPIEEYFNTYLFEIKAPENKIKLINKKLYIVKDPLTKYIIGSFFINPKYKTVEDLYLIQSSRGKGYCLQIINYLKKNFTGLYFDICSEHPNNIVANKCYSKYLRLVGNMSHKLFNQIYGINVPNNKTILRYKL